MIDMPVFLFSFNGETGVHLYARMPEPNAPVLVTR